MQVIYGEDSVDVSTVQFLIQTYKNEREGTVYLFGQEQMGQPMLTTDEFHRRKVGELIKNNWCIIHMEIAVNLNISKECVGHNIYVLQYQKV